jgi:hypothetical protein
MNVIMFCEPRASKAPWVQDNLNSAIALARALIKKVGATEEENMAITKDKR